MENLRVAFNAVFPNLFYMAFGFMTVNLFRWTDRSFLSRLNGLVFKCFFPIVMFTNFLSMDISEGFNLIFFAFSPIMLILEILLLFFIIRPLKSLKNDQKGVFIQATFRSNAILFAFPLSASVFGDAGVAASSLITAVCVPIFNIASVIILEYFHGNRSGFLPLLKKVLQNPLILGALAGTLVLFLPFELPEFLTKPINALSSMTTPLAVFILGGSLTFTSLRKNAGLLSLSLVLRLVIIPLIIVLLMIPLPFNAEERFATLCLFGTPTAVASFTMAANMGGDPDLAAGHVAVSTTFSMFTIFIWIILLKSIGFI